jgi:ABC-type transport system involved in Fe-S cluster assembly fused permease/ATPase subunit
MEFLIMGGIGLVIVVIATVIRTAISCAGARKLLRQAEAAESVGNLDEALTQYKALLLAVAANKEEVPKWLARIEGVYKKKEVAVDTSDVLAAHKTIADIWDSKMSDGEKNRLHKEALQGMKVKLDALP